MTAPTPINGTQYVRDWADYWRKRALSAESARRPAVKCGQCGNTEVFFYARDEELKTAATTGSTPPAPRAPSIEPVGEVLRALREIALGIRLYGAPDRALLADRIERRLDQLAPASSGEACERLKAAVEGECNGLAISDEQAASILAYLTPSLAAPAGAGVEEFPLPAPTEECAENCGALGCDPGCVKARSPRSGT